MGMYCMKLFYLTKKNLIKKSRYGVSSVNMAVLNRKSVPCSHLQAEYFQNVAHV